MRHLIPGSLLRKRIVKKDSGNHCSPCGRPEWSASANDLEKNYKLRTYYFVHTLAYVTR